MKRLKLRTDANLYNLVLASASRKSRISTFNQQIREIDMEDLPGSSADCPPGRTHRKNAAASYAATPRPIYVYFTFTFSVRVTFRFSAEFPRSPPPGPPPASSAAAAADAAASSNSLPTADFLLSGASGTKIIPGYYSE